MKRFAYIILSAIGIVASTASCSTEEIETYSGVKAGIFIQDVYTTDQYGNPLSYRDSTAFSFSSYTEDVTTFNTRFVVRAMGNVVDYDRPYRVEVIKEESTAIEGEDFNIDQNESMIKAGEATDNFYIQMIRTPKLRQGKIWVKVRIVPNEHFETPISEYKNSSAWNVDGPMKPATTYKVVFSEEYTEPLYWSWYGADKLGKFTATKYLAFLSAMNWTVSDFNTRFNYGSSEFWTKEFRKYLQAKADAGTPLIDEDGSYMQLASKYEVNYSAYINPDNE